MSLRRADADETATDIRRDPYIDFLRVLGVVAIVAGHWVSATAWRHEGRIGVNSILSDIPQLAVAAWVFMTVPVLLFVAGYANARLVISGRQRGTTASAFLIRRLRRLLPPAALFLSIWALAEVALHALDIGGSHLVRGVGVGGVLPFAPLWFLAVYLVIVTLCPATFSLHERFGGAVIVALVAGAVLVDVMRLALHVPHIGWLNLVLVWLLPHQLGYLYADGTLSSRWRRLPGALCVAGLSTLIVATTFAGYPVSIGGVPGDRFSNMRPPTLVIVALALWQIGLAAVGARWIRPIVSRPPVARVLRRANALTMSIYLWHMTALLLTLLILEPFGLSMENPTLTEWMIQRPAWLIVGAVVLAAIVRLVRPVEQIR